MTIIGNRGANPLHSNFRGPRGPARFERLDQDSSGALGPSELMAMAEHMSNVSGRTISPQDILARLDRDGSNDLSQDELSAVRPGRRGRHSRLEAQDTNGSGGLDQNELAKMAAHLSEKTGRTITPEQLLSRLDMDNDGEVSRAELRAGRSRGRRPPMGLDAAASQSVPPEALEMMASRIAQRTGRDVSPETLLATIDTNGDGAASRQEMKSFVQDRLRQLHMRR